MLTNEESEREIRPVSLRFNRNPVETRASDVTREDASAHVAYYFRPRYKFQESVRSERMPRTRRKFLSRRIVFGKTRTVFFDARFLCDRTFFSMVERDRN